MNAVFLSATWEFPLFSLKLAIYLKVNYVSQHPHIFGAGGGYLRVSSIHHADKQYDFFLGNNLFPAFLLASHLSQSPVFSVGPGSQTSTRLLSGIFYKRILERPVKKMSP